MTPEIKTDWLNRARMHAEADRFIQGQWLNGMVGEYKSGCFFGCMTQCEDNTLEVAAEQMKTPIWLIKLAESIFEGLPGDEAVKFPVAYLEAMPTNLSDDDYETIRHKLGAKRMTRMYEFVKSIETNKPYKAECLESIEQVRQYHINPAESAARSAAEAAARSAAEAAWSAAWSAARSVARSVESAAWSAARSAAEAARSAAWSAARSAESAARSAARSAESAESAARSAAEAAWSAARSNEYINERDDLFSVFSEFGVTNDTSNYKSMRS